MSEKIKVKVSHRFKASPERVYDAWLDPEKVRLWLRVSLQNMGLSGDIGQVEVNPIVGGDFLFTDIRDGIEARHWGTYLELERPNKIAFTWIVDESEASDPSRVVLTIQPEDEGCTATIVHELDAKWADYVSQTENGWNCMLRATDTLLENQ
ncbi:MAG: SRPBCC domain-containing protein [Gammaproteobacteria bacterium]|nr:SRPBCC domain-containing protein [Gammaproteobacteria bacterium]